METLTELGIKYKTDKATDHQFTSKYDEVLTPLRNNSINLLEIGVWEGSSLKMWKEYFQNGRIYALDVYDKRSLQEDRIIIDIADQGNYEQMLNIFPEIDFDVVIDDGGHQQFQQQITLAAVFPRLKSKSIYILEDLHTSYMSDYGGYYGNPDDRSTLKLLNEMATRKLTDSKYYLSVGVINKLISQIESIEIFFSNHPERDYNSTTAIIRKK